MKLEWVKTHRRNRSKLFPFGPKEICRHERTAILGVSFLVKNSNPTPVVPTVSLKRNVKNVGQIRHEYVSSKRGKEDINDDKVSTVTSDSTYPEDAESYTGKKS